MASGSRLEPAPAKAGAGIRRLPAFFSTLLIRNANQQRRATRCGINGLRPYHFPAGLDARHLDIDEAFVRAEAKMNGHGVLRTVPAAGVDNARAEKFACARFECANLGTSAGMPSVRVLNSDEQRPADSCFEHLAGTCGP